MRTARDTQHNLNLFSLVEKYGENDEDRKELLQYKPYVLRMNAIARAMISLHKELKGAAEDILTNAISAIEDMRDIDTPAFQFERIRSRYLRHALGMLLLGGLMYGLFLGVGHYHVDGVGYATIQAVLTGEISVGWLLAMLFAAKLLATTLSLGSGASGGIFSPSLAVGAGLGANVASLLPGTPAGAVILLGMVYIAVVVSDVAGGAGRLLAEGHGAHGDGVVEAGEGDRELLKQMLLNLVFNSLQAMASEGTIRLSTRDADRLPGGAPFQGAHGWKGRWCWGRGARLPQRP